MKTAKKWGKNPNSINGKNEKSKSLSVPKKDDLKLKTIDIDPGCAQSDRAEFQLTTEWIPSFQRKLYRQLHSPNE